MTPQNKLGFHRVLPAHFITLHIHVLLSNVGQASQVTVWSLFSFLSWQGTKEPDTLQCANCWRGQRGISAPPIFLFQIMLARVLTLNKCLRSTLMLFFLGGYTASLHRGAAVSCYLFSTHTQIHLSWTPHRGHPNQVITEQLELNCRAFVFVFVCAAVIKPG